MGPELELGGVRPPGTPEPDGRPGISGPMGAPGSPIGSWSCVVMVGGIVDGAQNRQICGLP